MKTRPLIVYELVNCRQHPLSNMCSVDTDDTDFKKKKKKVVTTLSVNPKHRSETKSSSFIIITNRWNFHGREFHIIPNKILGIRITVIATY